RGLANAVLTTADWPPPPVIVTLAGAPGMLVRVKVAGVTTPATVAVTVYAPAGVFAGDAGAGGPPGGFGGSVAWPANQPLAPLPGALNVTPTPGMTLPKLSLTTACRAVAKAVLTVVLWGVPAVTVMLAGAPGVLVRPKVAGVATPATVAVTAY